MSELENATWPWGSTNKPRGWATPMNNKPLRITVPIEDGFQLFVATKKNASGVPLVLEDNPSFVIELFGAVLPHLSYDFPHEFILYNHGTHLAGYYDDLIQQVSLSKVSCSKISSSSLLPFPSSRYISAFFFINLIWIFVFNALIIIRSSMQLWGILPSLQTAACMWISHSPILNQGWWW